MQQAGGSRELAIASAAVKGNRLYRLCVSVRLPDCRACSLFSASATSASLRGCGGGASRAGIAGGDATVALP